MKRGTRMMRSAVSGHFQQLLREDAKELPRQDADIITPGFTSGLK